MKIYFHLCSRRMHIYFSPGYPIEILYVKNNVVKIPKYCANERILHEFIVSLVRVNSCTTIYSVINTHGDMAGNIVRALYSAGARCRIIDMDIAVKEITQ